MQSLQEVRNRKKRASTNAHFYLLLIFFSIFRKSGSCDRAGAVHAGPGEHRRVRGREAIQVDPALPPVSTESVRQRPSHERRHRRRRSADRVELPGALHRERPLTLASAMLLGQGRGVRAPTRWVPPDIRSDVRLRHRHRRGGHRALLRLFSLMRLARIPCSLLYEQRISSKAPLEESHPGLRLVSHLCKHGQLS